MNEAKEKALWDFVRALARWIGYMDADRWPERLVYDARTVLAEEAPPVKERPACWCGVTHRAYHEAAPAPKQERGVEEILAWVRDKIPVAAREMEEALRLYREERAASEREYIELRDDYVKRGALEGENAALRARIESLRCMIQSSIEYGDENGASNWRSALEETDIKLLKILRGDSGEGKAT